MDRVQRWLAEAWQRLQPDVSPDLGPWVALVLGVVAALVLLPGLWRRVRVIVTAVHELGHAAVGVVAGRRFTGLVLRRDMSGHAVTVGRSRGLGIVASTWAGYPAPALVGAGLGRLAEAGWAAPTLAGLAVALAATLVRARSLYTAVVVAALAAVCAGLWWWAPADVHGAIVLGLGCFLVAGAWRHLAAVVVDHSPGADPAVLARLTRVPAPAWMASFAVVLAGATWWLAAELGPRVTLPG